MSVAKFTIPPFYTMEMMKYAAELERQGKSIYHLEVGQPIAPTPQVVLDQAAIALKEKPLNYCSALGYLELREAIAEHYYYSYQLKIDPGCIIITPGSSIGLYVSLMMNFNKGAKIAIAAPSYPCYRNVINALDFTPIEIVTQKEDNYLITPDMLAACQEKISGLLIASPNNPTGSVYDAQALQNLVEYCEAHNIYILSDELYHGITFGNKANSILEYSPNATVISGFSKYFAMTGWRIGWMVVPKEDVSRYESLLQNLILCTSSLTQIAAVKAFSAYEELDNHVSSYERNLNLLYDALTESGLVQIVKPRGAFYLYAELDDVELSSMDFCKKLLYEENVAVAPGMDFSSRLDNCVIRLSFCQHEHVIKEAAKRITHFIQSI